MRLLIANDDGIHSPGLAVLAAAAREFGDITVVAPDVERSSASHAITASRPLSYKRTPVKGIDAYRVNGTPADCVAPGAHVWEKVDVVLSGINLGSNLGNAMWHSGTLAAAKQAVLLGLRGIALSAPTADTEPDFDALKPWVERVLELLLPLLRARILRAGRSGAASRGMCDLAPELRRRAGGMRRHRRRPTLGTPRPLACGGCRPCRPQPREHRGLRRRKQGHDPRFRSRVLDGGQPARWSVSRNDRVRSARGRAR